MTKAITPPRARPRGRRTAVLPEWSKPFLDHLAASSNVRAAARKAGISTATAYEARRGNPAFQRAWLQALCEGYDLLEMELLHRLRSGEVRPPREAQRGLRSFDNATALRLLAAHRASATAQRALREQEDTEAILLSINQRLETMRRRRLAAEKRRKDAAHGA